MSPRDFSSFFVLYRISSGFIWFLPSCIGRLCSFKVLLDIFFTGLEKVLFKFSSPLVLMDASFFCCHNGRVSFD